MSPTTSRRRASLVDTELAFAAGTNTGSVFTTVTLRLPPDAVTHCRLGACSDGVKVLRVDSDADGDDGAVLAGDVIVAVNGRRLSFEAVNELFHRQGY
jgi:hypothetical protein